jgi:hypothetical protein
MHPLPHRLSLKHFHIASARDQQVSVGDNCYCETSEKSAASQCQCFNGDITETT